MPIRSPERRHTRDRRRNVIDLHRRLEHKRADVDERRHSVRRQTDRMAMHPHMKLPVTRWTTYRRPTLLWQLTNAAELPIECLAIQLQTGRTLVDVVRLRERPVSGIFDDAGAAVRWALALERSLIAKGWEKSI